jgi:hypothetical protein
MSSIKQEPVTCRKRKRCPQFLTRLPVVALSRFHRPRCCAAAVILIRLPVVALTCHSLAPSSPSRGPQPPSSPSRLRADGRGPQRRQLCEWGRAERRIHWYVCLSPLHLPCDFRVLCIALFLSHCLACLIWACRGISVVRLVHAVWLRDMYTVRLLVVDINSQPRDVEISWTGCVRG